MNEFNPRSLDAQFAKINTILEIHEEFLKTILAETKKTNGRVTAIEWRDRYFIGWVVGASTVIGAAVAVLIRLIH